ncbi:MAG: hypothetical protein ACLP4W_00160 [Mycobacterium sp.]
MADLDMARLAVPAPGTRTGKCRITQHPKTAYYSTTLSAAT